MAETTIEWATHVWNPVIGCDRVSPGCAHCYALELAPRLRAMQIARGQADGVWATQADGGPASGPAFAVRPVPERLDEPLRWRKPRPRVFVNSMSDLFHEQVPDDFIRRVFHRMAQTPQHTYLILTKRPERMRDLLTAWSTPIDPATCCDSCVVCWHDYSADFPLSNVWLGVSIESRRYVSRAHVLRQVPAAVRFISAEPLLGPLIAPTAAPYAAGRYLWEDGKLAPELILEGIDWLIVGGESGPRHRPLGAEWVRDLRDCAQDLGTAFFFKQWGGRTPKAGGRELDGRTWDELPAVAR